jgi:hypothetical protein
MMRLYNLFEGTIEDVYDAVEQSGTVNDEVQDAESAYVGGVGDLGDPEAANWLVFRDSYDEYQSALHQAVQHYLGNSFSAYRLMSTDNYEDWVEGGDLGFMSVSLSRRIAEAFKKFTAFRDRNDLVLVQIHVPYDAVVMRGHESEAELVIDSSHIEAGRQTQLLKDYRTGEK